MRHMRKSIDISIGKSVERFKDFDRDVESGNEIMETLSVLHELRNQLDEFQEQNKELFKGK